MAGNAATALVTGAASGIGAAVARLLAARGADVLCLDIDRAGLDAVVQQIRASGGSASAVVLDLANADAVAAYLSEDGTPLDQVALCAGIYAPTPADGFDLAQYRRIMDTNVTGAVQLLTGLAPRLAASRAPRAVTVSSVHAFVGEGGSSAYAASKGALAMATRALAVELAPQGILVNSIAPGFIETPMARLPDGTSEHDSPRFRTLYVEHGLIPLRRPGTPEEVAEAAAFLLSPLNGYITGHLLVVDGGLTATF